MRDEIIIREEWGDPEQRDIYGRVMREGSSRKTVTITINNAVGTPDRAAAMNAITGILTNLMRRENEQRDEQRTIANLKHEARKLGLIVQEPNPPRAHDCELDGCCACEDCCWCDE